MINILLYSAALTAFAAKDSPIKSVDNVIAALNRIVGWTYTIFFIAAAFFILMAAFKFLTAQAEPEKINSAKKQILYAVIAIVIALLSVSFDVIIKNFLGGESSSSGSGEIYGSSSSGNPSPTNDYPTGPGNTGPKEPTGYSPF